ncbi:MAG TPA: hypothetical protein VNI01_00610, partial [Elusimicrobiota bacterium]|nr:hypothetical protein [Elusimicrobiota bacterium]
FVRENLKAHGADAVRRRLEDDGVAPDDIAAALAEAAPSPPKKARNRMLPLAAGAAVLAAIGAVLMGHGPQKEKAGGAAPPVPTAPDPYSDSSAPEERIFRGHYGYILKLPQGYEADADFADAGKIQEVVHFFPKGTDRQHLINEGLYGALGILRLEVSPRRVPQGLIDSPTLATWVTTKLARDKAKFEKRDQSVHGMQGFVIAESEPFASAKAYIVGQKVYYTLTAGSENSVFNAILSSITEVNPHDEPGT